MNTGEDLQIQQELINKNKIEALNYLKLSIYKIKTIFSFHENIIYITSV